MKYLKSKKHNSEQDWHNAFDNVTDIITFEHIESKVNMAVERLKKELKGRKAFFAWSGGKDAEALRFICERAGLYNAVQGMSHIDMEYPDMRKFFAEHRPEYCRTYYTGKTIEWLEKNPEYLFASEYKYRWAWTVWIVQNSWKHMQNLGFDTVVLGHRTMDGNSCGKNGVYTGATGIKKVCPIFDFSHEEVFAMIKYYGLHLAPIYDYPDGFKFGTQPWINRKPKIAGDKDTAMDEIMKIDSTIIPTYADRLTILRNYCERKGIDY